jgi:hypothetical protein
MVNYSAVAGFRGATGGKDFVKGFLGRRPEKKRKPALNSYFF